MQIKLGVCCVHLPIEPPAVCNCRCHDASDQFHRLRWLEDGWDGRSAERPSEKHIVLAESLWDKLRRVVDVISPAVRMSRDGAITFSWVNKSGKEKDLYIWVYEDSYEVHMRDTLDTTSITNATTEDIERIFKRYWNRSS